MSTADSWLNTTSVLFTHDIIGKIIPLNDKQALLMARIFTFLLCILAVELTRYKKALIEIEWLASSFYMPVVLIPLLAGFLKFRTNSKSFIAVTIITILFISVSGYIVGDLATISLMCGMIGSARRSIWNALLADTSRHHECEYSNEYCYRCRCICIFSKQRLTI